MSIVIARPVFLLLSCRLFVSLAVDMKWKYSLSSTTDGTQSAFWHLKTLRVCETAAGPPLIGSARRLLLNFRCLRSCLRRDRWCLCRWMNTLLCALPFGLNISVSNVTNQMFISCYNAASVCAAGRPLCMYSPSSVDVHVHDAWRTYTDAGWCILWMPTYRHMAATLSCLLVNIPHTLYLIPQFTTTVTRGFLCSVADRMRRLKWIFQAAAKTEDIVGGCWSGVHKHTAIISLLLHICPTIIGSLAVHCRWAGNCRWTGSYDNTLSAC